VNNKADIVVDGLVLLELKAAKALTDAHAAQLLNYLRATPLEVGLLLNFGLKADFIRRSFENSRKRGMPTQPNQSNQKTI
jgi:GxxExxY protein